MKIDHLKTCNGFNKKLENNKEHKNLSLALELWDRQPRELDPESKRVPH